MKLRSKLTGGARIGAFNATWSFARLSASPTQIRLKVWFSGDYVFQDSDIISIHKYVDIPFLGWGIRIDHSIEDIPQEIIFWHFSFPSTILSFIRESGFNAKKIQAEQDGPPNDPPRGSFKGVPV